MPAGSYEVELSRNIQAAGGADQLAASDSFAGHSVVYAGNENRDGSQFFATQLVTAPPEPREAHVVPVVARTSRTRNRPQVHHAVVSHRVRHGQTLTRIAHKHGVTVASLRNANRLGKKSVLRPGQRLRIPVAQNAT